MAHQGFDLQLTRYDERGWRAAFYTTGIEHSPTSQRVLPMQLQIGDRLVDETGTWEVASRPYTTNAGKDTHIRIKKVGQPDVTEMRIWGEA